MKTHKVNITVDGETRGRMDEFPEVNYSSLFRTAVRVRIDKMRVLRDCAHEWDIWHPTHDIPGEPLEEVRSCFNCGARAKRVVSLVTYDYREED
jgi:hypothetical protein